jgi:hypothetical protein
MPEVKEIYDLLYCGEEWIWQEVKEKVLDTYPDAQIGNASDDIHVHRYSILVEDDMENYYLR